jgi:S-adenosylmethionine decarboxylase
VLEAIREAARRANSILLHEVAHRFDHQGVTALALLSESHISVHTWPELGYAACDVFMCGEQARPELACEHLAKALAAERWDVRRFARGESVGSPARPKLAGGNTG